MLYDVNNNPPLKVSDLFEIFEVTKSTLYRYIKLGKLNATKVNGQWHIVRNELFSSLLRSHLDKENTEAYFPDELLAYSNWHKTFDYISWLFKTCYSTSSDLKRKKFSIQYIFQNYITINDIDPKQIRGHFYSTEIHPQRITDDLKRGWYNELAFIYPLKKSTLGISFREISENLGISRIRFSFPSWKITECYYSSYFYLRTIAQYKNPHFRLEEHKATLNSFKNSALDSFKKTVWGFPLDIEYKPNTRFYASRSLAGAWSHLKYNYSRHPRTPHLLPTEIARDIYSNFRKRARSFRKPVHYTLFDYLLEFRIWANYLDIDNLLSLYGEGFKSFLDQNLSLILFFIGGLTELIYIAVFGEQRYIDELQKLYSLFAKNNSEIKDSFIYSSVYQRMKIYKLKNFISSEIKVDVLDNPNEIK